MQQQFADLRDIMSKQESQLAEKKENVIELIEVIEKLKLNLTNYQEETARLKVEKNRLIENMEEKDSKWSRIVREKERQH